MVSKSGASISAFIVFSLLHFSPAYCRFSEEDWVNIDCGSDEILFLDDNGNQWDIDDLYTDAGINKLIRIDQPLALLNTLRSFPNSDHKNCYDLPINEQNLRYIVRSAFLYGDYDGLDRPPAFHLRIDGKDLSAIKIPSVADAIIDELVYTSEESGVINVCLQQKNGGGVPFISALQAIPMDAGLYSEMRLNENFRLVARMNFGKIDRLGDLIDDYERSWTSTATPSNCNNVSSFVDFQSPENDPPTFVQGDAVESRHPSSPIILAVDFPDSPPQPPSAYFVFYFNEIDDLDFNTERRNRTMKILIDGHQVSTVTTDTARCTVVTIYPVLVSGSTANVTIAAADSTGLPPFINAMEVFRRISATGAGASAPPRSIFLSVVLMLLVCVLATSL